MSIPVPGTAPRRMLPAWAAATLLSIGAWTLVSTIHTAATYTDRLRTGQPAAFGAMLLGILPAYLPWAIFTTLLTLALLREESLFTSGRRLLRWLGIVVVAFYIPQTFYQVALDLWGRGAPWSSFGVALREWRMTYWLVDASLLLATGAVVAGIVHARHERRAEARRQRLVEENLLLRLQVSEQHLATIRLQLEPHFLFNTLSAIAALVRAGDAPSALDAVHRLSSLLRYAVGTAEIEWVTLREEWGFVREYLALQQLRHGGRLTVELGTPPEELLDVSVPPLLLQPLVENAIRHDVESHQAPSWIRLTITAEARGFVVEIVNSLHPDATPNPGGGLGLRATRDRLALTYGGDAALTTARSEVSFTSRLFLPRGDDV